MLKVEICASGRLSGLTRITNQACLLLPLFLLDFGVSRTLISHFKRPLTFPPHYSLIALSLPTILFLPNHSGEGTQPLNCIPSFTIDSLSLSSLNISTSPSQISGSWTLHFSNPTSQHRGL